ncbi:hypothetical protein ScPMuIL_008364 [Solemya velum]
MARWRGNFEQDLGKLIRRITGFEEHEENIKVCEQFALSNLKYHRFLDVDSHKVTRALNGVCEKFKIHSRCSKAESLRSLAEEFLATPAFEGRDHGKTDTHYSLLSLLLLLADAPIYSDYEGRTVEVLTQVEDEFDWSGHLLEGEHASVYQFYDEDSSDFSDEDIVYKEVQACDKTHTGNDSSKSEDQIRAASPLMFEDTVALPISEELGLYEGEEWLVRNVVRQYWRGLNTGGSISGCYRASNLASDWEHYQQLTNPLYRPHMVLTETELMREAIWMLSGVSDLFVFMYDGENFSLNNDVIISHLTSQCLEQNLKDIMVTGARIKALNEFLDWVAENSYCSIISQTYQAFSGAVLTFLGNFQKHLTAQERNIIRQEETMTLFRLCAELTTWLPRIKLVHSIYKCGVDQSLDTNSQRASQLLSVLFQSVLEYDTIGSDAADMIDVLLTLWLKTSKPYITFVDDWITNGVLIDPMKEFIVQRNETVKLLDENFWETAFTLHVSQSESPNRTSSGPVETRAGQSSQSPSVECWAPKFLHPVMRDIILAGKSMEMLQNLGRLADVVGKKDDIFYRAKPLYDIFLQSLEESLGHIPQDHKTRTVESKPMVIFNQQIEKQMLMEGVYDPLLQINFQTMFSWGNRGEPEPQQEKNAEKTASLQPLELILQRCLYPPVRLKYQNVCLKLVQILKEEYHLMEYLSMMKLFFLMEAGDTMLDFYTPIFDKIRLFEPWHNVSTVNLILHKALEEHYPEERNRLTVEVDTENQTFRYPINSTDCMKLRYKVPWPVNMIVSSRTQDIYNQIFNFLLQVKRAKYCLDELRFCDLQNDNILKTLSCGEDTFSSSLEKTVPRAGRIHRMQILRMRLLFFVNCLHNYIMTRILHSTGLEFKKEMEHAADLDEIIALHDKYVNTIHERCLLHKKVEFLKEAITKVLNLSLSFQMKWDQGVDEISSKAISDMETEFSRCVQFLSSFLNNIIKRGSFPHLESLAFALVTSNQHTTKPF